VGGLIPADRGGCITSTPKSADFSKKQRFWPKNERASCMPGPKNGERPYLAVPVPLFLDPFFASFLPILLSSSHTTHHSQPPILYFIFLFNFISKPQPELGMRYTTNTSNPLSFYINQ